MITIRTATEADIDMIAALHVRVWRMTYRSLAPSLAHERLDEAHRRPGWAALIGTGHPDCGALVADGVDGITGVIGFAPSSAPVFGARGEVRHLYVDPAARGQGIGRCLMSAAATRFHDAGHTGMGLAVVEGNDAAFTFYRALGGRLAGRFRDPGPLWRSDNLVMIWDDLDALSSLDRDRSATSERAT
ncbi:MAG: GNAT family N-acetyltransferase [Pseudomonadota bacterium]